MTSRQPADGAMFRRLLLVILLFGLGGTGVDLLLIAHYEDVWQVAPLVLIGGSIVLIAVHLWTGGAAGLRALQTLMGLCVVAGVAGMVLHYRGNLEFQLEIDPTQSSWEMFKKVVRAKSPPAMAPGVMAQLGLIGLLYTYRHPALDAHEVPDQLRSER
jgi:hypothetical protein